MREVQQRDSDYRGGEGRYEDKDTTDEMAGPGVPGMVTLKEIIGGMIEVLPQRPKLNPKASRVLLRKMIPLLLAPPNPVV